METGFGECVHNASVKRRPLRLGEQYKSAAGNISQRHRIRGPIIWHNGNEVLRRQLECVQAIAGSERRMRKANIECAIG